MSGPTEAINETIKGLINSSFPAKMPAVPMFFENQPITQPRVPYIIVNIVDTHTCRENIGSQLQFKKIGVINISCHAPEDAGTKALHQIADALESILIDRQMAVPGQGQLTTYECEKRTRGSINGFYTMTVATNYRAHVVISR